MGTIPQLEAVSTLPPALTEPSNPSLTTLTYFHLTGFSRFHSVSNNPTEQIANLLPRVLDSNPLPNVRLSTSRVLKVAAATSKTVLMDMYANIPQRPTQTSLKSTAVQFVQGYEDGWRGKEKTVFLHLGVNVCARKFALEAQAKNEATFSCADELGWAPIKRKIDEDMGDINAVCRTTLRVAKLVERMVDKGYDVEESMDAGKFVCNWVYFNSLKLAEPCGVEVLFVHVPPASVIGIAKQTEFVRELMKVIADMQ